MLFFKILQQLLLPSSFVLLLTLIGLFFWLVLKKNKLGKILIATGLSFYYLFSITPVSNFLLSPLEEKYSPLGLEDMKEAKNLVLLLGGAEADVLRGSEVIRISNLKNHEIKVIVSGTNPLLPTSEEALGVKRFFVNRGLPQDNILIDGNSRNTWESIRNVEEMVREDPFFLVTSAYHMKRALKEFEKIEASPIPAPTDFKVKTGKYTALDFFPDAHNLKNSDIALHEYLGMIWYSFAY